MLRGQSVLGNVTSTKSPPAASGSPRTWIFAALCCAVLVVLVTIRVGPTNHALLYDDSFQYLSVAENARQGFGIKTSIAHFDEERSWGALPAPITTFPVGYPLAIAAVSATGLHPQTAALFISMFSCSAIILLIEFIFRLMGITPFWRMIGVAAFVLNCITLTLAASAVSEALFTALSLSAVALLALALRRCEAKKSWVACAIAAGLALGCADWVRYAGLLFWVGISAAGIAMLLSNRRNTARPVLLTGAVAALPIFAQALRNIVLVGSWRGGNTKVVARSLPELAHLFETAVRDLLLGRTAWTHLPLVRILLAVVLCIPLAMGVLRFIRSRHTNLTMQDRLPQDTDLVVLVLLSTYLASILYIASRTMISLEARLLFPIFPVLILLLGSTLQHGELSASSTRRRRVWLGLSLATLLLYGSIQLDAFHRAPPQPAQSDAVAELASKDSRGMATSDIIRRLTGAHGTLMATNGQALGYLLGVPTVSLVGPEFSSRRWDEGYVRDTIRRFSVSAVALNRFSPPGGDSDFISDLASGHAPSWLIPVATTPLVVIYRPSLAP